MDAFTFQAPCIDSGGGNVARAPALLARLCGLARPDDADQRAGAKLSNGLEELNAELAVPTPEKFGILRDSWHAKIDLMAEQAVASGSPANNPRVPSKAEIIALYGTMVF